jgi:uncharacterized protein (DUF1778 family)
MPAIKEERLNLRLSARDNALIKEAAETRGTSVSEFVTQAAVRRAHQELADQRHFVMDDETWDQFVAALDRPAKPNERLASFLRRPSLLDPDH